VKYFKIEEFACKGKDCCNGSRLVDPTFLEMLDNARGISGVPYIIRSGYRCFSHNKAIGSTSTNHIRGLAADIETLDGPTRGKVLRGLYLAGFRRVGISFAKGFVHADINDGPESCFEE
jgi:uncharacterized protein YcbK (DUF882 family)